MTYVVGCFVQGLTEVQFEFDGEEFLYADFPKKEIVYTVPNFIFPDPSHVLVGLSILEDALDNRKWCLLITKIAEMEEKYVPEEKGKSTSASISVQTWLRKCWRKFYLCFYLF